MTNMEKYIYIFFIYSMAGWCMETFGGYFRTKKLVNRGFLIGPYLPVYGFGVSLITFFLEKYVNDLPILFFMSIIICGLLEYFTSWIMEKLFKARWWDYHNRKFNINGRICLETLIPFGATGTILLKFANPFVLDLLNTIPHVVLVWILRILIILIFIDVIISFTVISKFKKTSKEVEKNSVKDDTEEISKMVKEVTTEKAKEIKENTQIKLEEVKTDIEELPKKIYANVKLAKNELNYTSQKIITKWKESSQEIKNKREIAYQNFKNKLNESNIKFKKNAEQISNSLKNNTIFKSNKDYSDEVKKQLIEKSWFTKRLAKAYPNLIILSKKFKDNKNNKD